MLSQAKPISPGRIFNLILFTVLVVCLNQAAFSQENAKSRSFSSEIFDTTKGGNSCSGANPALGIFQSVNDPEYEAYSLTATYYTLRDGLTATLMLNNKGPQQLLATPTLYSLAGTRLQLAPIAVAGASYLDVDMHGLLANAPEEFREGSLKIAYQGGLQQLGAQIKLVDTQRSLIWAEQFVYTTKFTSSRLENVWWLPYEDSITGFVVSNTSSGTVTAAIAVDGTSPRQAAPVQVVLAPWETRVLDIMWDLVGNENGNIHEKGGISITHTGEPGAVLARMFIAQPSRGYSAVASFSDPASPSSQRWQGTGIRLRNLNGAELDPVIAARNTGEQLSRFKGRIIYTRPDGQTGQIELSEKQLPPRTTKIFNLASLIDDANVPTAVKYGSIELEYDTPKGSVITSVQSVSPNGDHVFQVPMFDPQKISTSAAGFPWKADGDFRTIVYIKNETDLPQEFSAYLLYPGGGGYALVKQLKARETAAIDFREIRDASTPDARGNKIPLNLDRGQIAYSANGENKTLSARSEQISVAGGVASTYACINCCLDSVLYGFVDPGSAGITVGNLIGFTAYQVDENCSGQQMPSRPATAFYSSNNLNAATMSGSTATGVGVGEANVEAFWNVRQNYIQGGACAFLFIPIVVSALLQVDAPPPTVTITKVDGSALPNPYRLGVNGGDHDRTQTLKATVAPPSQAANVAIQVSSKITGSISTINTSTGVITFTVVGNSESSAGSSCSKGDSFIRAVHSGATLVNKPVFVSVPSKVATPHDTTGAGLVIANRVLDANTSPAWQGLAANDVMLATIYVRYLTNTVKGPM